MVSSSTQSSTREGKVRSSTRQQAGLVGTRVLYETEIIRFQVHSHGCRDSRGGKHECSKPRNRILEREYIRFQIRGRGNYGRDIIHGVLEDARKNTALEIPPIGELDSEGKFLGPDSEADF
jgi:hypothetical protein